MQGKIILSSLLIIPLFLVACACPKNVFVLLPDADGLVGAIELSNEKGSVLIDEAGQSVTVADPGSSPHLAASKAQAEIEQLFGAALRAEPLPPECFLIYFENDSTRLKAQSRDLMVQVMATIKDRESVDISVVGHTDRTGSKIYNLNLSTARAEKIRDLLVEQGVDAQYLQVTSYGEANPLVATPDNVAEPKNRRVEVVVR